MFINRFITFSMSDVGYPFRLDLEVTKLMPVFRNAPFDEPELAGCNKQVKRPPFQDNSATLSKCRNTEVKVGLR